jgi:hypothetical protein
MALPSIQQLLMIAFPHGGQGHARRNAWAGMAQDASVARARREADLAMAAAVDRARRVRPAL